MTNLATVPEHLYDAESNEDIKQYYSLHQIGLAAKGFGFVDFVPTIYGAYALFAEDETGKEYVSIFIRKSMRGKGFYEKVYYRDFDKLAYPVITSHSCKIEDFLRRKRIPFLVVD